MESKFLLEILTLENFLYSMAVLLATGLLVKLISFGRDYGVKHWGRKGHWLEKTVVTVKFAVYAIALYIILATVFNPSREAIIALTGGTAVAVGFAARNFLENILAGIVLLFERPIYVGDRIKVDDFYGDVVGINVRSIRLKTLDDSYATVPNSMLIRKGVKSENAGAVPAMVIIDFYFHHKVDLELIKKILWEATVTSRYFYSPEAIIILVDEDRFSSHFSVKAYTADVRKSEQFRADVTLNAKKELQNYAEIYPQWAVAQGD